MLALVVAVIVAMVVAVAVAAAVAVAVAVVAVLAEVVAAAVAVAASVALALALALALVVAVVVAVMMMVAVVVVAVVSVGVVVATAGTCGCSLPNSLGRSECPKLTWPVPDGLRLHFRPHASRLPSPPLLPAPPQRIANDARRLVKPGHTNGPPGPFQVSFADRYPWLLASEASLADLNARMAAEAAIPIDAAAIDDPVAAPVFDMRRFRPNMVVAAADGPNAAPLPPWVEDTWTRLSVAGVPAGSASVAGDGRPDATARPVVFQVAKPCDRCKVPTIRPDEGAADAPVVVDVYYRTMNKTRRVGGKVMFGMNLVCDSPVGATVSVGDTVSIEVAPAGGANEEN